ncbi:MAG: transposase [Ignavibacteria bacterium]|nr:transposase [Ignavibacteria bacterium]
MPNTTGVRDCRAHGRNKTFAYFQPGRPFQNTCAESFVGTIRREFFYDEDFGHCSGHMSYPVKR